MLGKPLLTFSPLHEGILVKRYKRFLADVELASGELVTAHCANTGPMKGVLHPGGRVRLRYAPSPTRKLAWSWEQAEVIDENNFSCWCRLNVPGTDWGSRINNYHRDSSDRLLQYYLFREIFRSLIIAYNLMSGERSSLISQADVW